MIIRLGQLAGPSTPCETVVVLPDAPDRPATAVHLELRRHAAEMPHHHHRREPAYPALPGAVTCGRRWVVDRAADMRGLDPGQRTAQQPPYPPNARLAYLFVEPGAADIPRRAACTLSISRMIREMGVAPRRTRRRGLPADGHFSRLARVLLDELTLMPGSGLRLPASSHPKIALVTAQLAAAPAGQRPCVNGRKHVGVSERSFGVSMDSGNEAQLRPMATTAPPSRCAPRTRKRRECAACVRRPRVRRSPTAFIVMFKKGDGHTASTLSRLK